MRPAVTLDNWVGTGGCPYSPFRYHFVHSEEAGDARISLTCVGIAARMGGAA